VLTESGNGHGRNGNHVMTAAKHGSLLRNTRMPFHSPSSIGETIVMALPMVMLDSKNNSLSSLRNSNANMLPLSAFSLKYTIICFSQQQQ
jgi:hypothetical protein